MVRSHWNEFLPVEQWGNNPLRDPDNGRQLYRNHHRRKRLHLFLQPDANR